MAENADNKELGEPVVSAHQVSMHYRDVFALRSIDLTVRAGESVAVIGPNGSGKSTLMEVLAGLKIPTSGEVRVNGLDPARDRRQTVEHLSIQLQASSLPSRTTVGEIVTAWSTFTGNKVDPEILLTQFGLDTKTKRRTEKLSGGESQRLSLVLSLLSNPSILVLDELTTGLDPLARDDVWQVLAEMREQGRTMLIVSHFMEEVELLCDRAICLQQGAIVAAGSIRDLVDAHGRWELRAATSDAAAGAHLVSQGFSAGPSDYRIAADSKRALTVAHEAARAAGVERDSVTVVGGGMDSVYRSLYGKVSTS